MMTRADKDLIIADLKEKINNSQALFLTNLIGVTANEAVTIRKEVRDSKGTIIVTRNSLFGKAAAGTYAEELLTGLKGTNAVAFAFEDAPGVAKAVFNASKDLEQVTLSSGFLDQKLLSETEVAELASLPSRDEMLGTLLATFNAPISAFARVINALKDEMEAQGAENPAGLKTEAAVEATAE